MKKYKQYQKVECIEQAYNEAVTINNYINAANNIDLYKVNNGTLEIITIVDDNFIQYDTHSLFNTYKFIVGTGYYCKQRLIKNDDRIGRRKLYTTGKSQYFIENGYRCYLKEYTVKGEGGISK